ncbi:MAG TPA: antitoxin family protein [Pirellulaceae bacterium]|nr:antitoxin family protein [Pirellulaceae bacterium]
MSQRIEAIFQNGTFRPQVPVSLAEGQRVSLSVESRPAASHPAGASGLGDLQDLLDTEFMESCRAHAEPPPLEEVRQILSAVPGSLADWNSQERDER